MRFCVWWFSRGVLISELAAWNKVLSLWCFCFFLDVKILGWTQSKGWLQGAMDGYVWLNALLLNVRFAVRRTPLCYLMITACGKVDVCLISAWSILLPPGHRLDQNVSTADRDIRWCTNTSRQCASIRSGLQFLFWRLWQKCPTSQAYDHWYIHSTWLGLLLTTYYCMEAISFWPCWGVTEARVALTAAFSLSGGSSSWKYFTDSVWGLR